MRALVAMVAAALCACSGHPNANQAAAVGLAAFGTGLATTSAVCADRSRDTCLTAALAAGSSIIGVAIAAAATFYLRIVGDEAPQGPASQPYKRVADPFAVEVPLWLSRVSQDQEAP